MYLIVLILFLNYFHCFSHVNFCKNTEMHSINHGVNVTGCTKSGCDFFGNTNVYISLDITPLIEAKKPHATFTAKIFWTEWSIPGFDSNICKYEGVECPIQKQKRFVFTAKFYAQNPFITINTNAILKIFNEHNRLITCVEIQGTIHRR
ncbi:hypothetical protein MXB_871 [Myxobolus squamalis]|nr:hypothetical protein MXB_871 [Myxobolus squamalis]